MRLVYGEAANGRFPLGCLATRHRLATVVRFLTRKLRGHRGLRIAWGQYFSVECYKEKFDNLSCRKYEAITEVTHNLKLTGAAKSQQY